MRGRLGFALSVFVVWLSSVEPVSSQTAVGTIAGTFEVTLSGSASYSIPLRVAPGTAGTEPKLALSYDSQSPGASLGAGWSIAGLSTISRGPRSLLEDGLVDGVRLLETDALYVDGQKLVVEKQTGSGAGREVTYRKEIDDQSRVVQRGADFGSSTFVIQTKGGINILFEGKDNSRVSNGGAVLFQSANRIVDTAGNYIEFTYKPNGFDVESIRYTGHEPSNRRPFASVEFIYEQANRPSVAFVAGRTFTRDLRLKTILSRVGSDTDNALNVTWSTVARYELEYTDVNTSNRFLLSRLRQFGEDATELVPTVFKYSEASIGWAEAAFQLPAGVPLALREQLGGAFRFAHVSDKLGSLPDLLFAAQVEGKLEAFAFQNDGGGLWSKLDAFKPPVAFKSDDGSDLGVLSIDLDGNGQIDLLQGYKRSGAEERAAWLAKTKWESSDGYKLPFNVSEDGKRIAKILVGKLTGGPGPDILYQSGANKGFLANTTGGWSSDAKYRNPGFGPPVDLSDAARFVDVDCDGKPELVVPSANRWEVYRYDDSSGWTPADSKFRPPFPSSVHPAAIRAVDLNADNCPDLIVAQGSLRAAYYASASAGWTPAPALKQPRFELVDAAALETGAVFADFDKDGREDVIASRRNADGTISKFAWRQTSDSWEEMAAGFEVPPLLDLTANAPPTAYFVGDTDGDGYPDVLLPAGTRTSFGKMFVGASDEIHEKPEFVPPVAFARRDQQDRGVRFVDLNGDGLPDVLFSREMTKDGKTELVRGAIINRPSGWENAASLIPPLAFASDKTTGNPLNFIDVDGDGFVDLLYSYRRSDGSIVAAYYRNAPVEVGKREPRQWVEVTESAWTDALKAHPFAAEHVGNLGVRFLDINGDGRPDILAGNLPPRSGRPIENSTTTNGQEHCEWNRQLFEVAAFLNSDNGWVVQNAGTVPGSDYRPPIPFVGQVNSSSEPARELFVSLVDVNGDRLPDIVARFKHPHDEQKELSETWINTGNGWKLDKSYLSPMLLDDPLRDPTALTQWMDINGDGLSDLIFTKKAGDASRTWLSNGAGFVESAQWRINSAAISEKGGDPSFRILDVNGDGFLDVIYARQKSDGQIERGLFVNNGTTLVSANSQLVEKLPAFIDKDGMDQGVRLIDVDGNGLVDIVQAFASADSSTVIENKVLLNSGRRADVLQRIEPGYGLSTSIFYQTMLEADTQGVGNSVKKAIPWDKVFEPGTTSRYPIISPIPASYLVRRSLVNEGQDREIAFSYRYGDFRVHTLAMKPLGFGWRESFSETNGVLTRAELSREFYLANKPVREATCWIRISDMPRTSLPANLCPEGDPLWSAWAQKLSESFNKWTVSEGMIGPAANRRTIRQISLAESRTQTFELDGGKTTWQTDTFTYDEPTEIADRRLNVLSTRKELGDGTSVGAQYEYAPEEVDKWRFGRLTKVTVTKIGDLISTTSTDRYREVRSSEFGYDAQTGLVHSETADAGHVKAVTTRYLRDKFGNTVRTIVSSKDETDRISQTVFDPWGRFAISETNPIGHSISKTFQSTTGKPVVVVGPNGLATHYEYDGFGRPISETTPTGLVTRTILTSLDGVGDAGALLGLNAAYASKSLRGDLPAVIQIFDNRGRPIRTVSEGFAQDASPRPIHKDVVYDLLGRNAQTSLPYFRGSQALWGHFKYDVLNRVRRATLPNGAVTTSEHRARAEGGTTVIKTDALGRKTRTDTNMRQLTVLRSDALNGQVTYRYDAGERLLHMTGATGAVTRHRYDDVGRRVETSDPDLGTWQYEYDAFSRLVRQTDAKNQIFRIEYDLLGRMTRRIQNDYVATFQYDDAPFGAGKPSSVSGSDGYRESYGYDRYGRNDRVTVTEGRETFTTTNEFDAYGRVRRLTFPTGVSVVNRYDKKGFHVAIENPAGDVSYWKARDFDQVGRVVAEELGNGVRTISKFDPRTGRPTNIAVSRSQDEQNPADILNLDLNYDLVGNLSNRHERVRNIREVFEYDDLDRLTGMTPSRGAKQIYKFDAAGRMKFKTGMGDYTYASSEQADQKPYHAVLKTNDGDYAYDRNGNLISNPEGYFEYSSDNRVKTLIKDANQWVRFDYNPSGNRYRQFYRKGENSVETIYLGNYERVTEYIGRFLETRTGRLKRHRHFLSAASGVVAVIETNTQHPEYFNNWGSTPVTPIEELLSGIQRAKVWYLHKDHLGSILRMTDETKRLAGEFWYDPWGEVTTDKTFKDTARKPGDQLWDSWSRGYSSHEHLDLFSIVHMNGRAYDHRVARFMSVDFINQSLTDTQTGDGYLYARANPLRYVDPSGYGFLSDIGDFVGGVVSGVGGAIGDFFGGVGHLIGEAGKWLSENWRTVVIVAVAVAVSFVSFGIASPLAAAIVSGMLAGAASSATAAILYGGNIDDVFSAAAKGAVIGAVSAGAFYGVGSAFQGAGAANAVGGVAGHGVVGGAMESAQGGDFWRGFAAGAVTKISAYGPKFGVAAADVARAAVVGGTVSAVSGGKFVNGAIIGAFSYAFNDLACHADTQKCTGVRPTKKEIDAHYRDMTGYPVYAETMDPAWLGPDQFDAIAVGKSGGITTNWTKEMMIDVQPMFSGRSVGDRNIYGSFTATRVDQDHFLWKDRYNFEMHPATSFSERVRNAATWYGEKQALQGQAQGKGFDIIGTKPVLIPGRK